MIGIDTNVLVRYATQDDPEQSARATTFMRSLSTEDPGFVSLVTLVETVWTLRASYKSSVETIAALLALILAAEELVVQESDTVRRVARESAETRADFADLLIAHLGIGHGCDHTVTFDRRAAKVSGMLLLE